MPHPYWLPEVGVPLLIKNAPWHIMDMVSEHRLLHGSDCRIAPLASATLLGVRVDDITLAEAVAWAEHVIQQGEPRQVATVNVEFLMAARRDRAFRETLNRTALNVPDSVGVFWGARLLGWKLRERVPGVDLAWGLAELAARRGYGLFLLGAAEGVAARAAERLRQAYPALRVVGTHAGSPDPGEEEEIVGRVQAARPHILLVAYGAPRQDLWIARNRARLGVPLAMGVGGTLDYIAGIVPRAPCWIRRLGLEWLYRLCRQPWRWRRMLALPRYAALILWQWIASCKSEEKR